jgi:hypothetical protein
MGNVTNAVLGALDNLNEALPGPKPTVMRDSYALTIANCLTQNEAEDMEDMMIFDLDFLPPSSKDSAMCSFFALMDGTGGTECVEYFADKLLSYVNFLILVPVSFTQATYHAPRNL